ncbi:hypothetical protein HY312_04160 [Candidatus Saccharibacteria bacterium]|nr:hypothetical protein [Candidatus Saccharibacteria bacterium]
MNIRRMVTGLQAKKKIAVIVLAVSLVMIGTICVVVVRMATQRDDQSIRSADDSQLISETIERLDKRLEKEDSKDAKISLLQTKVETYKSIGQYDQALVVSKQLAGDYPENASFQADIARLYALKSEPSQAKVYWQRALSIAEALPSSEERAAEIDYYQEELKETAE